MVNDASRRSHDSKDELRGPRISVRSSDPGLCGNANPKPDVPRQSVGSDSHIQARTDQFVLTGRVD